MPLEFETIEQVVAFMVRIDPTTLDAAVKEVKRGRLEAAEGVRQIEKDEAAAFGTAVKERVRVNKVAVDQIYADFDDAAKREIQIGRTKIDELKRQAQELANEQKRIRQDAEAGGGTPAGKNAELAALRGQERDRIQEAGALERDMDAAVAAHRRELRSRESEIRARGPANPEEESFLKRREQGRDARYDASLLGQTGQDADLKAGRRRRSLGGRMFEQAERSFKVSGSGADAQGANSVAGIGAALAGVMVGMTNPISALVTVASGIKDIVSSGYELALKNASEQAKLVGGTSELARRAGAQSFGLDEAMQAAAIRNQRRLETSGKFSPEEKEQLAGVIQAAVGTSPRLSASGNQIDPTVTAIFDTARMTGLKADEVARTAGDMARRQGFGGDAAGLMKANDLIQQVNLTASKLALASGDIDPQKLTKNILTLIEQLQPFGVAAEEASAMAFKFRNELDKGTVTLAQLAEMSTGMGKQDAGNLAYTVKKLLELSPEEAKQRGLGEEQEQLRQTPVIDQAALARVLLSGKGGVGVQREVLPSMADLPQAAAEQAATERASRLRQFGRETDLGLADRIGGPATTPSRRSLRRLTVADSMRERFSGVAAAQTPDAKLAAMAPEQRAGTMVEEAMRTINGGLLEAARRSGQYRTDQSRGIGTTLSEYAGQARDDLTGKGARDALLRPTLDAYEKLMSPPQAARQAGQGSRAGGEVTVRHVIDHDERTDKRLADAIHGAVRTSPQVKDAMDDRMAQKANAAMVQTERDNEAWGRNNGSVP